MHLRDRVRRNPGNQPAQKRLEKARGMFGREQIGRAKEHHRHPERDREPGLENFAEIQTAHCNQRTMSDKPCLPGYSRRRMERTLAQPLVFEPLFMERIWGGRELERRFGKNLPAGKNIGESWEIVDRVEAQSVVRQGPWKGKTLHQLWSEHRAEIFGGEAGDDSRFPILAKLLDARESLSLQVHPREGAGSKTEMWYVLAAVPGGAIRFGLKRGVERAEFESAVRDGRALQLMHSLSVNVGDAIFVPGGRLHAISAGNLLVEIQQNSDTTFRLFDWNRVDANGEPRALQIDEALATTNFSDFEPGILESTSEELVRCSHFVVDKWSLEQPRRASERTAFALFLCLEGAVEVNGLQLKPGEFFLVPASAAQSQLEPLTAGSSVLRTTLPAR